MAARVRWDDLMNVRFDTSVGSLPFAVEPVQSVQGLMTVLGIDAFLNASDDKVRGVWWATDLQALVRVLHERIADDRGRRTLDPPPELLPKGADRAGTFGSLAHSLRSQGITGVTGSYTRTGEWNYRELTTGRAGFSYAYRLRSGDHDPVAVISISLARPDWVPDRKLLRRGASDPSLLATLRTLFKKKSRVDSARLAWGESLRQAGLWSGLPEAAQLGCVGRLSDGEPLIQTLEGIGWPADGEDLADGLVETLLKSMKPALAKRGVRLSVRTIESPHGTGTRGYAVEINGKHLDLYRLSLDEPSLPLSDDPWLDCTMRPIRRVNELLVEAGSNDRIVIFQPGGNDGFAILASPPVLESLVLAPAPSERPVVP